MTAVVPSLLDETEGRARRRKVGFAGISEQRPQIVPVLGTIAIVTSQHLEGDKVRARGNAYGDVLQNGQFLSGFDDLAFDTGLSKQ